ncbi:MAG: lipopolysaccharide assembly protein LapA domain-containing protein [Acidimicrobiia bacterium]|nr:lipopolysaccharide assembly protein LapA domain-containing protein [Acidimicrobiia bacterium]
MTDPMEPVEPESQPPAEEAPGPPPAARDREGIPWGFLFGSILLAGVIVFAVQNSHPVFIRFLGWSGEFPLSIAVAVAVFASVILTQSIGAIARRRRRRRKAEKEELRALREQG